ncbi:MAG: Acyl-[acyl-carrier-protein]--UDP-N-acetylglucosamine O-acyltransferase [Verrucomicrobiota bacterium]
MSRHPTAIVHPATRLHASVSVGAYAVIEDGVEIGAGSVIREHVVIRAGTQLGEGCDVDSHAVLGGLPQDTRFDPNTPSGVRIGNGVVIREGVTVNRAVEEGTFTSIGDRSLLMANSHVGHDCQVGQAVILANGVLLGGRVQVGDHTFIGGGAAIHQFCRIGESAMIGGMARVSEDLAPFCLMAERNAISGLNLVGLRRRGFSMEEMRELKGLYRHIFSFGGRPRQLAEEALRSGLAKTGPGVVFLRFISLESKKGLMQPHRREERS